MNAKETIENLTNSVEGLSKKLPEQMDNFQNFAESVISDGALSAKMKLIIAVSVAITKRCEYCIVMNLKKAIDAGVTKEELLEACSVVMLLDGGPAMAYTTFLEEKYDELTS